MDTKITIPDQSKLDAIRTNHGLRLILLHGSQVGGPRHAESDIDVAVLRDPDKPSFRYLKLIDDLIEAFNSDRIDLVDLTHADPLLLYAITKNCLLLSGEMADLDQLTKRAFLRYGDYRAYLNEEATFVRRRLATYVTA